ncbi:MAG: DUF2271 domain-containing protein [Flavitalea sp.]
MKSVLLVLLALITIPALTSAQTTKVKCMVQMTNYVGEGAYIVVSIVDAKGNYDKTLAVMGDDKEWYPDWKEWHKAYKKKPTNLSAITGASVAGGDRSVVTLEIETAKLNANYTLRFESAVEDKQYHIRDIEVPLTTEGITGKKDGTNYIRYVRFSAAN